MGTAFSFFVRYASSDMSQRIFVNGPPVISPADDLILVHDDTANRRFPDGISLPRRLCSGHGCRGGAGMPVAGKEDQLQYPSVVQKDKVAIIIISMHEEIIIGKPPFTAWERADLPALDLLYLPRAWCGTTRR